MRGSVPSLCPPCYVCTWTLKPSGHLGVSGGIRPLWAWGTEREMCICLKREKPGFNSACLFESCGWICSGFRKKSSWFAVNFLWNCPLPVHNLIAFTADIIVSLNKNFDEEAVSMFNNTQNEMYQIEENKFWLLKNSVSQEKNIKVTLYI